MNAEAKSPTLWLTRLLEEAKSFEGAMFPPIDKVVPERDTVIGDCPEELKPLWSYARYCERETKQAQLEIQYASSEEEKTILSGRFSDMHSRQRTMHLLFWSCLNEHMAHWSIMAHLGLREGWKVVRYQCDETSGMPGIFRQLFGQ